MKNIRPIAFYLPQFHPIPENDLWWGKGFTEWTNVTKSKPLFAGHYQPHLPADLGFYDLRLQEARIAQELLAKQYGIFGFCYYHYWFNGKLLLNEPIDRKLKNPDEDLPFMLCWANENWTRRWDGKDKEILLEQKYSSSDDKEHIHYLIKYFKDPRYIKVGSKPVFIVYKPYLFPNATATVKQWRSITAEYGIELYLCHTVFSYYENWDKPIDGFDAVIDFEPFGIRRPDIFAEMKSYQKSQISIYEKALLKCWNVLDKTNKKFPVQYNQMPYEWMGKNLKSLKEFSYKIFPGIVPGWDNTSRRNKDPMLILKDSSPDLFEDWLRKIKDDFVIYSDNENFIFLNAWNEWAEGNHLEPCQKWGKAFLEKLKKVLLEE